MPDNFTNSLSVIESEIRSGRGRVAISMMASLATPDLDYDQVHKLIKLTKKISAEDRNQWIRRSCKIALLCSHTTSYLTPLLKFFFFMKRIELELLQDDYSFESMIASRDPALLEFKPDICILSSTHHAIANWPTVPSNSKDYTPVLDAEANRWMNLQSTLVEWLGTSVIQDGFCLLPDHPLGHFEDRGLGGKNRYLRDLNEQLRLHCKNKIYFNDVDFAAARVGRKKWLEPRWWFEGKFAIAPDCSSAYCFKMASMVAAIYGLTKKCLVVDLDNTLWGGVIGDDGLSGIVYGEGSASGEGFKAFHSYVKALKKQGALLAVCSKNDEATAKEPFLKNSEFILSLSDFEVFVANWQPKSENLAFIAKQLNIGLDSLVFFDDNPAERTEVQMNQPDVFVVSDVDDPSDFIARLDTCSLFEPHNLTKEDLERSQLYAADQERTKLSETVQDQASYLKSLEMIGQVRPFVDTDIPRISQLINKTNQFNLTTRRTTEAECQDYVLDSRYVTRSFRLKDRFGDNGLISAVVAKLSADSSALEIETWIMSCRVLRREVELLVLEELILAANQLDIPVLRGKFIPTERNGLVANFYRDLGFTEVKRKDSITYWELERPFQIPKHHIHREKESSYDPGS